MSFKNVRIIFHTQSHYKIWKAIFLKLEVELWNEYYTMLHVSNVFHKIVEITEKNSSH